MKQKILIVFYFIGFHFICCSSQDKTADKGDTFTSKDSSQQYINTGPGNLTVNKKVIIKKSYVGYKKTKNHQYFEFVVDTKKDVTLILGSNVFCYGITRLSTPVYPLAKVFHFRGGDTNALKVVLRKNKLIISSRCYSFDDKVIFRMDENVVSDRYEPVILKVNRMEVNRMEVKDNHDVPVYKISIDKRFNLIILTGLFFNETGCYILSPDGMNYYAYPAPYGLMSQSTRDSVRYYCTKIAYGLLK